MEKKEKKAKEKLHSNRIRIILEEIGMSQQELADIQIGMGYNNFWLEAKP